jgi:Protein of unknown function (DUF2783)
MALQHNINLVDPDTAYKALIDAHTGLTEAESQTLNASLVLLLANHIGDLVVLREAIETARTSMGRPT